MLSSLLCLALVITGILWMCGVQPLARRLLWGTIALAIVLPILLAWAGRLWAGIRINKIYMIAFMAIVLLAAALVAWIRYVSTRRAIAAWWSVDSRPTSTKKRRLEESL